MEKIIEQAIREVTGCDATKFAQMNETVYKIAKRVVELSKWDVFEIPEGYEARIEGNKVILERKESEDERIRKHIIKILDNLAPCHWDGNEKARCIAYLERQKGIVMHTPRYAPPEQQPAEWSEEDKETLEKLHRLLVICRGEKKFIQEADYNRMDNLLNSVRRSWKPSEEQMEELLASIEVLENQGEDVSILDSLYNDLKKL